MLQLSIFPEFGYKPRSDDFGRDAVEKLSKAEFLVVFFLPEED